MADVQNATGFAHFVKDTLPEYLAGLPVPSTLDELQNLSLYDLWTLTPLIMALHLPLILYIGSLRYRQAFDLEHNQSGLFQWASVFYNGDLLSVLPFLCGFIPGLFTFISIYLAGEGTGLTWLTFFAGYFIVPLVDLIVGENSYNPTEEQEKKLTENVGFRLISLAYTPSYIATVIYGAYVISTRPHLTTVDLVGIAVSTGVSGGFGIGCVHELIHRPHIAELSMGILATVFANYSHFWIEHLWGHHKRVATDEDPASSNLGDTLYGFLPRCMLKSFTDALDIERRFREKRKKSILEDRILLGYATSAVIAYVIYAYFGTAALAVYLAQGFITALHIENANYIEHYGLRRRVVEGKVDRNGEPIYERPGWFHAWDTGERFSNWILFNIQRHPDHHTNAGRPYQILRTLPQSPTLPTGYAGMFVLSWIPPLYFAIMDPLVENAYRVREDMEAKGIAASAFPKGSNNISSWFKKEGEGFFEKGSSVASKYGFAGGSDAEKKSDVWDENYDEIFEKNKDKITESRKLEAYKASLAAAALKEKNQ
jgi:alkane 1-monooxygenase